MKQYLRLAARLYPRPWRDRYGEEFEALLDEAPPTWRDAADIVRGALAVHLTTGSSYLRFSAVLGAVGLVLGAAASFKAEKRYVSTGVVRLESEPGADDGFQRAITEVLSRGSLAEIVQRPSLDLYRSDRARIPMENIIQGMRKRDIRIAPREDGTIEVSFAYSDPKKAEGATRVLMNRLADATAGGAWARRWKATWPDDPLPPGQRLVLVSEPQAPEGPISTARAVFLLFGAGTGVVAGWLLWRPRRNFQLAGFALLGWLLVLILSYGLEDRYKSRAVLRVTPPDGPKRLWNTSTTESPTEQFQKELEKVLEPEHLAAVIVRRELQLYPEKRRRMTLPEVVQRLRERDLKIAPAGKDAFVIAFSYRDRYKAQLFTRTLASDLVERYTVEPRLRRSIHELELGAQTKVGPTLEVLDAASLPEVPVSPNRAAIASAGVPLGLLAGLFLQRRKRAVQTA